MLEVAFETSRRDPSIRQLHPFLMGETNIEIHAIEVCVALRA